MEEMYCFEDWYSGKVNLDTEPLFNVGKDIPTIVSLNNFTKLDQERILEEKRIIFDNKVGYIFDGFKNEFLSRFDNSNYKLKLLDSHIKESFAILNNKIPNVDIIKTKYWEILFAQEDLIKIQYYYKTYLLKGNTNNFHFVHSVNSKYYNENCVKNEVYSKALNDFHIFLTKLENRLRKKSSEKNDLGLTKNNRDSNSKNKSKNINSDIFVSDDSSDFFLQYVSKLTKKNNAVFACIYSELIPLNGFQNNITKSIYCDFIAEYYKNFNINLTPNEIKSKSRNRKCSQIVESLKNSFKERGIIIPFKI